MKSRIFILIAAVALVTLSFTFASSSKETQKNSDVATEQKSSNAPAGGFALEEK